MDGQGDSSAALGRSSNAAARLRRSISAARAAEAVEADDSSASLEADDDDSSLVLYRDPSRASAQSRGSVQSGAHEQGDTFFTALKKQPSWQSDTGSDLYSQVGRSAAGSCCGADSQVNPVQSVSHSAFFSAAEEGSAGSWLGADEGSRLDALGPSMESSYATAPGGEACNSPQDDSPQGDSESTGGQLTSSVLNIIDSLYGGQAAAARQSWQQQLSTQDQPLRDMPVQPVPPPAPADAVQLAAQEAKQERSDGAGVDTEAAQGSTDDAAAGRPEGPGPEQCPAALSAGIATSELPSYSGSALDADEQPADQQHSQLDCAAAEPDATEDSSADRALLAGMEEVLAERSKLQQELSGYLTQLASREDGEGQPLVDMVQDYGVLVERLLRKGRAQQYRALQGWDGPHRFEDLPVAQMRTSHTDPEVAAGLAAIAKLDEELREASLKALVSARALNPEQWADAEKRRLEKRAAELDAALSKERQRRAHTAKLRGALNRLDEQCSEVALQSLMRGGPSFSYYMLKPQEEELLATVLSRDEASLEAANPFDPNLFSPDDTEDSSSGGMLGCDQDSSMQEGLQPASGSGSSQASAEASGMGLSSASSMQEAAGGGPGPEAAAAATGRLGSGLASVFSLMRPSSASSGRRHSLAEIDAQLQAMQVERELAQQLKAGATGLSRSSSSNSNSSSRGNPAQPRVLSAQGSATSRAASSIPSAPSATPHGSSTPTSPGRASTSAAPASRIPSAPAAPAVGRAASTNSAGRVARVSSCSGVGSVGAARQCSASSSGGGSRRSSAAASGSGSSRGSSGSTVRAIDYIREQREVKELLQRERELDTQLRALQTSELPTKLAPQQLQALLQSAY